MLVLVLVLGMAPLMLFSDAIPMLLLALDIEAWLLLFSSLRLERYDLDADKLVKYSELPMEVRSTEGKVPVQSCFTELKSFLIIDISFLCFLMLVPLSLLLLLPLPLPLVWFAC